MLPEIVDVPVVSSGSKARNVVCMWSYKYTSSASVFVDQCRVGARLEVATPRDQLVEIFSAVSKEQVRRPIATIAVVPLS